MQKGWLTRAGKHPVEHITWPYIRQLGDVDLAAPAKGLLHTTQGATIEGALSVFRQHYAPHFTVGVDAKGRGRLVQHVPLGKFAAALENLPGGVETNRDVRVQIEIVGYTLKRPWLPDPPTRALLVALVAELEHAAGIPLRHPRVARDPQKWLTATGWVGHIDAPENDHVDPGALNYMKLFELAGAELELGHPVKPRPRPRMLAPNTAMLMLRARRTPPSPLSGSGLRARTV